MHACLNLNPVALLADAAPGDGWFASNWGWVVGGLIVIGGLIGLGRRDVMRFSIRRAWAISGICFAESIRKRVLWITPLAIVGVIVVTQLERAYDEADAIRQTIKFCLFASGMVVILTSIILACTNLPKEIESRVIYTIVTKPTTRLEIIVGKVIGFARVSLAILLIMGIFTSLYLRLRAHGQQTTIAYRLREGDISDSERARLSHYESAGLLTARTLWAPDSLQIYGRVPDPASKTRVFNGEGDEELLGEYRIERAALFGLPPASGNAEEWSHQGAGELGVVVRVRLGYQRTGPATDQPEIPSGPLGPSLSPTTRALVPPTVGFELLDQGQFSFLTGPMIGGSTPEELLKNIGVYATTNKVPPDGNGGAVRLSEPMRAADGASGNFAYAWVPPDSAIQLFNHPVFYVKVGGESPHTDYQADEHPIQLYLPRMENGRMLIQPPGAREFAGPAHVIFRGRVGLKMDQELKGGASSSSVAVFSFRGAPPAQAPGGRVPFEISTQVDRENSDATEGHEDATSLEMQLINLDSKTSTPVTVNVESRRPAFFTIPAEALAGGNYDLVVRCPNVNHRVGFYPESLQLIQESESFEWNLLKSLSILWMMSILVIALAVPCSTFLSWPIAIVLTIVLLLGRWGVNHLADTSGAELGRQIVNDFTIGKSDASVAKVVSSSVEALSTSLNYVARILPDPSSFDAIGDIEQGVSLPSQKLNDAFMMMGGFALPAIVIGYLILKNKEVAP